MWVLYFRNTSCCIILSKEAPHAESKSAQIETNSPHVKINFTLDISNSTVPMVAVIMLIICAGSLSLFAISEAVACLFKLN